MTQIYFADSFLVTGIEGESFESLAFQGFRTLRIATDATAFVTGDIDGFGGGFEDLAGAVVRDLSTGERIDQDGISVLQVTFRVDGQTRSGLWASIDFNDDDSAYVVRISGDALPLPPPDGVGFGSYLLSIGFDDIGLTDQPGNPFSAGSQVAYADVAGVTFGGPGLAVEEALTVAYLYEAVLDRDGSIDLPGLNFWIDAREDDLSEAATAQLFLESPEFAQSFGDPAAFDDRGFVELLYQNVLGRSGEGDPGLDFWTGTLAGDTAISRAEMLIFFVDSPENVEALAFPGQLTEVDPGEWAFI